MTGDFGKGRWLAAAGAVLLSMMLAGCAVPRTDITGEVLPFSGDARARLGKIGIVPASATNVSLTKPMDRLSSTVGGMGVGAFAPFEVAGAGVSDPITLIIVLGLSAVSAPIGGTIGYFQGMPAEQIKAGEEQLRTAAVEMRVEELMCTRILQNLSNSPYAAALAETNSSASLVQQGFDTMLEAAVLTIGLKGESAKKAPLRAWITCQVRLVRASDGVQLFSQTFTHLGPERTFSEWSANRAEIFRRELDAGATILAHDIVSAIFSGQKPVQKLTGD